jgi:hypothetical protein
VPHPSAYFAEGWEPQMPQEWDLAVLLAPETMQSPILQLSYQQHRIPPLQKTQGRATRHCRRCFFTASTREKGRTPFVIVHIKNVRVILTLAKKVATRPIAAMGLSDYGFNLNTVPHPLGGAHAASPPATVVP